MGVGDEDFVGVEVGVVRDGGLIAAGGAGSASKSSYIGFRPCEDFSLCFQ